MVTKRTSAWIYSVILGLVLATPQFLAQASVFEGPSQPQGQSPESPDRGVFLPCGAKTAAEVARMRLRVELPPVPPYPDNGKIPEELRHRLVFLDVETGELIVSFPRYSDFEELEAGQEMEGGRIKDRVALEILTCPSLSVAIYPSGDPRSRAHVYHYRLHNRRQARQSIWQMVLPIPLTQEAMPVYDLVPPYGWHVPQWDGPEEGEFMQNRLHAMTFSWGDAFREEVRRSMIRRRVTWHAALSKYVMEPGNTLDAYMLSTEARPGIVRAYIQGAIEGSLWEPDSPRSNWGEMVCDQLWAFHWLENSSLSIATIGPKFSPDAEKRLIAADFLSSLEELIQAGELAEESPFIRKVLGLLETVAAGGDGAVEAAYWPSDPETDFQAEILMAIRLSLGN